MGCGLVLGIGLCIGGRGLGLVVSLAFSCCIRVVLGRGLGEWGVVC